MNTNKMVNYLYENLKAIQVEFTEGGKQYTYKTFEDYEVGDKCIVDSPEDGYVVVTVVNTDSTRLEEDYRFKFAVQKIDDTNYLLNKEQEQKAVDTLSLMQRESKREEAKELIKELIGESNLNKAVELLKSK